MLCYPNRLLFVLTPGRLLRSSLLAVLLGTLVFPVLSGDRVAAQPVISVTATTPEAGPAPGVFTITRTGDTSQSFVVPFGLGGTATKDADYTLDSTSALTLVSQPFAAGMVGQGFNLNGDEQYVQFPDDPNQDPTQEATLDAWVNFSALPSSAGHFMVILGKSGFGKDLDVQAETDNHFRFYVAGGACCGLSVASSTVIQTNTWYHVAATYKANSAIKMYVNGQLENTTVITVTREANGDPVTIGESSVFRGRFFDGVIDEAHMWNRELVASEIASIANAGSAGLCKPSPAPNCIPAPAGLVGWWPGDGVAVDLVTGRLGVIWGGSIGMAGASATINVTPTGSAGSNGRSVVLTIQPSGSYTVSSQAPSAFVTLTGQGPTFSLSAIQPNAAGDTGAVTAEILGEAIPPGATAKLTRSGQPDIPAMANSVGTNGVLLTSTFDLGGAPLGSYDVVVTNPDNTSATLAGAFTVTHATPQDLFVQVVARTIIRVGNEYLFYILYGNRGNVDAPATPLFVSVPNFVTLTADTTLPFTVEPDGDRTLVTATLPSVRASSDQLPEVFTIKVEVANPADAHHRFTTRASIGQPFVVSAATGVAGNLSAASAPEQDASGGGQNEGPDGGTDPRTPNDPNDKAGPSGVGPQGYLSAGAALPYAIYFENEDTASLPAQDVSVTDQLDPQRVDLSTFTFGPMSFGDTTVVPPAGQQQFVTTVDLRPDTPLIVKITASLDTDTGKVTWLFNSLDPVTGEAPDDPLVGFLPPNKSSPQGQGAVQFTVSPRATLATGTVITNQARVVFDVNPPIDTPTWTNTIARPTNETLKVTPRSLRFSPEETVGGTGNPSPPKNVKLSNASHNPGPIAIENIQTSQHFALADPSQCVGIVLQPGASCTFGVHFVPGDAGSLSGTLTITDNALGSPQILALEGTGKAGKLKFQPVRLGFGSQAVSSTSNPKVVIIRNPGPLPISIASVTPSTEFNLSADSCSGTTLASGDTCAVSVQFSPTTKGPITGTLTIADNTIPQSVTLSGTGQ